MSNPFRQEITALLTCEIRLWYWKVWDCSAPTAKLEKRLFLAEPGRSISCWSFNTLDLINHKLNSSIWRWPFVREWMLWYSKRQRFRSILDPSLATQVQNISKLILGFLQQIKKIRGWTTIRKQKAYPQEPGSIEENIFNDRLIKMMAINNRLKARRGIKWCESPPMSEATIWNALQTEIPLL